MAPGIATLLRMMPDGYEEACFSTGAIVRKRDIRSPDDLMMLCLFHLLTGCSLIEISELAKLFEIGDISDVAFMKRFQNCNEWFKWIISHIKSNGIIDYTPPEYLKNYRLLKKSPWQRRTSKEEGKQHFCLAEWQNNDSFAD